MNLPAPSLVELLGVDPASVAIDDRTQSRTWCELDDRVARLRGLLAQEGVGAGDHIAMVMGNRSEFLELVLAAMTSGVWLTPVNWHSTVHEIAYVLDDAGADIVLVDPIHREITAEAASGRHVVEVGRALDERLSDVEPVPLDPAAAPGANMFYTSGTTGRPKGVKRRRQPAIAAQLDALRTAGRVLGLDGGGPHLVTGPMYHAAPLGFAVMDLLNGAPLVTMPTFDEVSTLAIIDERRVRNTHLVPTMFVRLLRLPAEDRERFDLGSLATVLHGAAPIAPAVKQAVIEWWGPVLVEYWGASEGGVVTLASSDEWLARPGTVGRPIAGHEVLVVGDDGNEVPLGADGLLLCRNTAVDDVFEYHRDPAKTAGAFRGPGTYSIGDIGHVDEQGYVYLADRASNMIISGGVNIYPAEVEAVLGGHPAVADVAVFGIPDDEWGESVRAAVELHAPAEPGPALEAELVEYARERLARFKVPRSFEFHRELPRAPTGKLSTRQLRDPYWGDRDTAI